MMQGLLLTKEEYDRAQARLEAIKALLKGKLSQTFVTAQQLQELLGIPKRVIRDWRKHGSLPYHQPVGKIYFALLDVIRIMALLSLALNLDHVAPSIPVMHDY